MTDTVTVPFAILGGAKEEVCPTCGYCPTCGRRHDPSAKTAARPIQPDPNTTWVVTSDNNVVQYTNTPSAMEKLTCAR